MLSVYDASGLEGSVTSPMRNTTSSAQNTARIMPPHSITAANEAYTMAGVVLLQLDFSSKPDN